MSLDTVPVAVPPISVTAYIKKLDERGETYGFNVTDYDTRQQTTALVLSMYRKGSEDLMEIRLKIDGTWTASHVLVVGDKL